MAVCHYSNSAYSFSLTTNTKITRIKSPKRSSKPVSLSSISHKSPSYNNFVYKAVRLLGPPARFEASKLKVVYIGKDGIYADILPRTYTLSHCDFTANLTLTISSLIHLDQLKGWYNKDDVVAEWKEERGNMYLDVHCYVSGPNQLLDLAAEFRYYIFSKELPLVLKAVVYGDSVLFKENQELLGALVRVYFHSGLKKYNRVECWGTLDDAIQERGDEDAIDMLNSGEETCDCTKIWESPKSIFQALVAFSSIISILKISVFSTLTRD